MYPARIPVRLQVLAHGAELPRPEYQTPGAAGFDLRAALKADEAIELFPGDRALIPTGIAVAVPAGYELQVRSRSGLAYVCGLMVLNSPGTIDSDYRGEIKVILHNTSTQQYVIERGDRIAQAVLCPVLSAKFVEVESLDETERGGGGFGSTGSS
jgi:dUTP pyrophosphatase